MTAFKTLLLAHHGTAGALLAERLAYRIAAPGTRLVHLLVVPDFWAGMQGDDWLNNASTRDDFGRHVEKLLEAEAAGQIRDLAARCAEHGLAYESRLRVGDPADCLVRVAGEMDAELVVIGPPRPKGVPGYRSRMDLEKLARGLAIPFLVAAGQP
jgi:nucleotide-binding universal stress UspA family protein